MFMRAVYNTNEVLGSFWRPHDYMAHTPTAKVTSADNTALSSAATVSLSEEGLNLAASINAIPTIQPAVVDITADNNDQDVVKRYIYNGVEGTVKLVDVAV